jgi:hypothetical protein
MAHVAPDEGTGSAPPRAAIAQSLHIDGYTGEVVHALHAAGVRPVLLKGPALVDWLYGDGSVRPYVDCDLLVATSQLALAERVLGELDFEREPGEELPAMHASAWVRAADGAQVDLHRSLPSISAPPADTWRTIARLTEPASVGGRVVEVPQAPVRALIVALHAAHHGAGAARPIEDLRRAIRQVPLDTWISAMAIAERLNAEAPVARGLRLVPEGWALADRLGLPSAELVDASMHEDSGARLALGFERLSRRRGKRAKLALLWRELFPSRDFIRWWWPPAKGSALRLPLAYALRLVWILRYAWPSARAWREARRRDALRD